MNTMLRGAFLICAALLLVSLQASAEAVKETKAAKETKTAKDTKAAADVKEPKAGKDTKPAADAKEPKAVKETKPAADAKAAKSGEAGDSGSTSYQTLDFKAASFDRVASKQAGGPKTILLKGNVELTLTPDDPSQKPLVMHATEAAMQSSDPAGNNPDTMELTGKVTVDGEMGTVTSNKAVMDMKTRNVVFTGNVVFNLEMGKGKTESLSFNMDTQEVHMTGSPTGTFQLSHDDTAADKPGAPKTAKTSDPSALKVSDITDWPGLIGKIQEQAKGSAPSPGKQIMKLLNAKAQSQFAQIPASAIPDNMKAPILGQLNGVIRSPKFYEAKAWDGIDLSEETNALLRRPPPLQPAEVSRLNRLLLEAAYPNTIAAAKKAE